MAEHAFNTSTLVTLVAETCCDCGMAFGMSSEFRDRMLANRYKSFYCPAGHSQHYLGESEADKYRRIAQQEEARADDLRAQRDRRERQLAAARGRITKIKNRVAAGVCPCCSRTFSNLARHMAGKHPDYKTRDIG